MNLDDALARAAKRVRDQVRQHDRQAFNQRLAKLLQTPAVPENPADRPQPSRG